MVTKANILTFVPNDERSRATAITDLAEIKKRLADRSIVSEGRFLLPVGKYEFDSVEAAAWPNTRSKNRNSGDAMVVLVRFKDGSATTLGTLRKTDASNKNYGPAIMPLTEEELLDNIMNKGLEVKAVANVYVRVFDKNQELILDKDDESGSGYKTKKARFIQWDYAK